MGCICLSPQPCRTVFWFFVGSLRKPLGNGRIGNGRVEKWLGNGKCTDTCNLERICAGV